MNADAQQAEPEAAERAKAATEAVLALAQKLHDEYVAEGQNTRERLISEGQSRHDQIVGEATARQEELVSTGQAKYDEFVSAGKAKHDALRSSPRRYTRNSPIVMFQLPASRVFATILWPRSPIGLVSAPASQR